jgi:two-component system, OmpR family, sensor kinase
MEDRRRAPRQTVGLITLAFSLIGVGALAISLVAMSQARGLVSGAREIAANSLTSVRLLGHLDAALRKRRILVDNHIFTASETEMRPIDAQIAAVSAEIQATERLYERYVSSPVERTMWERTKADLAAVAAPMVRVLALSRLNRDADARAEMNLVAAQWAQVGQDLDTLVNINDRDAMNSVTRVALIGRHLMELLLGLGLAAFLGTVLAGRWAARQVGRREAEMGSRARALETRNRELDAFAGRVAHDVRGPLAAFKLAMPALAAKLPKGDRTLELLGRGVTRMEALVEDLLTLARVESQPAGRCDPAAVVAEVEADFASRIAAENGALRVSVHHADVSCSGGLLRQAVTNLVENAVKYHRSEAPPEVEISGAPSDGGYDLAVSDNGVGMSDEEAEQVAQPFYRAPRVRDRPGTGLGLSIVRRVAEASGGKLSVRSRLGRGSTFVVRLPLAKQGSADQPVR